MAKKIYRIDATNGLSIWEFQYAGIPAGQVTLSVKLGKRRKLKSMHLAYSVGNCECCGGYTEVAITRKGKTHYFDNHLGISFISADFFRN
jgi:hypothetical protein